MEKNIKKTCPSFSRQKQVFFGLLAGTLLGAVLWAISLYAQGPSVFVTLILAILLYFVLYYLEQGHPTVSFLPFKLTFLLPFTISFLTQIWYYLSAAS